MFTKTAKIYVAQKLYAARKLEFEEFWELVAVANGRPSPDGFREVYKRYGYDDLAEVPAEQFRAVIENIVMNGPAYRG